MTVEPTEHLMLNSRDDQSEPLVKGIYVPAAEGYSSRLPDDVARAAVGPVPAPSAERGARIAALLALLH